MPQKPSRISRAIPTDPLERICFFFSAIVMAFVLCAITGCASAPPAPPKQETCLLRAPRPPVPADADLPGDPAKPAQPGALECWLPKDGKGITIPFEEADKFICNPPNDRRQFDLYLKLRGL